MSQQPDNPQLATSSHSSHLQPEPVEYSTEERLLLLKAAHDSIEAAFKNCDIPSDAPTPHLAEPRGAFTTLYLHGQLRGCVGYVFPVVPLYRTVIETARASAFEDTRFYPVTQREALELEVHLSVLSRMQPIRAEEVEVGRHGLLISMGGARGLLLPQVPVEQGWNRVPFLEQTCRKAGLSLDAWQRGALIEAFTAEVFGDRDLHL
ncbi:MAG: AMMECR1 domain-containing protein [Acidobacteria bacterium]|nr:MAG: AMMECR1 domain-containing protein [Acidobacteriota bacterium]PYY09870.1 MAG: AMMECR1 domain-containing protein [Acidobacteriota bacterium]